MKEYQVDRISRNDADFSFHELFFARLSKNQVTDYPQTARASAISFHQSRTFFGEGVDRFEEQIEKEFGVPFRIYQLAEILVRSTMQSLKYSYPFSPKVRVDLKQQSEITLQQLENALDEWNGQLKYSLVGKLGRTHEGNELGTMMLAEWQSSTLLNQISEAMKIGKQASDIYAEALDRIRAIQGPSLYPSLLRSFKKREVSAFEKFRSEMHDARLAPSYDGLNVFGVAKSKSSSRRGLLDLSQLHFFRDYMCVCSEIYEQMLLARAHYRMDQALVKKVVKGSSTKKNDLTALKINFEFAHLTKFQMATLTANTVKDRIKNTPSTKKTLRRVKGLVGDRLRDPFIRAFAKYLKVK